MIRVAYAGCEPPRCLAARGQLYAPPPTASDLPGLEAAGEIVAVGEGVGVAWSVGDKVCALLPRRRLCRICGDARRALLACPRGHVRSKEAACLPETFFTVWSNVFMRGGLKAGRAVPGAWRLVGDRNNGDPTGPCLWRAGFHHCRI